MSADEAATPDDVVTLYYFKHSSPSRKCLIALYEKGVEFEQRHVDLVAREQHERWYLEMNPRGEVPVLKHGQTVVVESTKILEYIDRHFGKKEQLYPSTGPTKLENVEKFIKMIDAIPTFPLTYGAAVFHKELVTDTLRYPYNLPEITTTFKTLIYKLPENLMNKSAEMSDIEAGRVLKDKAAGFSKVWPIFQEVDKYKVILAQAEAVIDEIEKELSSEEHLGAWLCGPTFSAADVCAANILFRLHQIGLDDKLWTGGRRPCTAVYAEAAFKRPSVEKATEYSLHRGQEVNLQGADGPQINSAYVGVGAAIALGAVYAYKKLRK